MTKEEKEQLAGITCYLSECFDEFEEELTSFNIQQDQLDKIDKAYDLILEVNQFCFDKKAKE